MVLYIKNYFKILFYKFKTKIKVDEDFYDSDIFYLIDLECDKNV